MATGAGAALSSAQSANPAGPCDMLPSLREGLLPLPPRGDLQPSGLCPRPSAEELGAMAGPLLHRLPLADPSSDSLGRLNGQYPALTYVDCADDVGVPLVAAHLTAEPIPGGTVVCMCVAASGAGQRNEVSGPKGPGTSCFLIALPP